MTGDFAALELSRVAVLQISRQGEVVAWNRGAEELYGYAPAAALGRAVDFLCFPGERTALAGGACRPEGNANPRVERHRRRDGSEVFVELRLADSGDGLLVCARDVTEGTQAAVGVVDSRAVLEASRRELQRLAGQVLDAQEDERRRIARELHDDFKQRLAAHGFELAALAESLPGHGDGDGATAASQLESLIDGVEDLGGEIRRISHQLHPDALERLGLQAALETHAAEVKAREGLEVRVTVRGGGEAPGARPSHRTAPGPDGLGQEIEPKARGPGAVADRAALGLYRIAQEALANAAHHSGARQAHLTLVRDRAEGSIRLAIADDGAGFDPVAARVRGGLGLAGMEERARLLGGRLRVASEPGAGTEIEVVVPLGDGDGETEAKAGDAAAGPSAGDEAGTRLRLIGPYRLLEVLGQGATATVYLAEEPPPLCRRLAVKLYRVPLAGRRESFSFKAEHQALARLRHPNVGQIHEARTTEDGDPYLVMEYVPGMPITDYCDRYRLDLKQRVELFRAVCDGVQHVHQKGVLHRDLKPANVLVMEQDGKAVPKIVDFGIAKGLEAPLAEGTVWTQRGAGTPAYVSPEVLAGGEADTRSDVYALGVMLYELLTGVLPAETDAQILGQLAGESLPRPSRRLATLEARATLESAAARRIGPRTWVRSLEGDLDWIAAKALAHEPEMRYAGAAGLGGDLGRHLRAEPVLAGPPTLSYRLARFARRHRATVAAAVLGLLALLGGLAGTAWQARRATRQAELAEQARLESERVTGFLEGLFEVSDPEQARGEAITAREILDRGAGRLERELAGEPRVRAQLQRTVAGIYRELGLFDEARSLAEQSLALHRELYGEDHPETAKSLRTLAAAIFEGGRPGEAEPLLERALAIQERTLGEDHPEVAETLTVLATALSKTDERAKGVPLFRRAHEIVSAALPPEHPKAIQALRSLGAAIQELGDPEQARIHYLAALELGEEHLGPDHPQVLGLLQELAFTYQFQSDFPRGKAANERLLARLTKVYGADHWRTLEARLNQAWYLVALGDGARGRELAAETHADLEETLGPDHWLTLRGLYHLGVYAIFHGQYDQAEAYYERALAAASATDSGVFNVGHIVSQLAEIAVLKSDLDRAEALASSVVERLPAGSPFNEDVLITSLEPLIDAAWKRGDLDRAEARIRELLAVVDPEVPGAPTARRYVLARAHAHLALGQVLAARGDAEGARESFELSAELTVPLHPNPWALESSATALLHLGRVDEAREVAREALERYRHPELIELCERHGIEVPTLDG